MCPGGDYWPAMTISGEPERKTCSKTGDLAEATSICTAASTAAKNSAARGPAKPQPCRLIGCSASQSGSSVTASHSASAAYQKFDSDLSGIREVPEDHHDEQRPVGNAL